MVKQGYKQTEIGLLPEDWELSFLIDKCELLNGLTYTPSNVKNHGLLVLRSSNVQNGHINLDDTVYVNCIVDDIKYIKKDDILICVRNGSTALIGKCAKADRNYNATFGAFMAVLRGKNNAFVYQLLQQGSIQKHINKNSDSTINQITNSDFKSIVIPWPSEEFERDAIATALSDIDSLIDNIEKLIAKKKAIKQGAMQELLTGKRRLPGFDGKWINIPIKQIGDVITGSTPSRQVPQYWGGSFPWISAQDFCGRYISKSVETITKEGMKTCRLLPEGSVLVTCIASIGRNAVAALECATNQQINAVICHDEYHNELIYYVICHSTDRMLQLAGQTAVPIISKTQFEEFAVYIPQDTNEQVAIALILADMDDEIYKFEELLLKYREIKAGMMSKLLTGRIRLIEKEES